MAIASLDDYISATKNIIQYSKLITISSGGSSTKESIYQVAGNPGQGVLAGTSTTSGVLITNSTAGFPSFYVSGTNVYLTRVSLVSSVACSIIIQDLIYKAGAYSFNSNVTLSSQPSISGRVINSNYNEVSMYIEGVTATTGSLSVTITYTNQSGTTGRSSTLTGQSLIAGKLIRVPLQAGDTGVQKVESVVAAVATAGTFNVLLVRDLYIGRIYSNNGSCIGSLEYIGLPEILPTSAINVVTAPDSSVTGAVQGIIEISSK